MCLYCTCDYIQGQFRSFGAALVPKFVWSYPGCALTSGVVAPKSDCTNCQQMYSTVTFCPTTLQLTISITTVHVVVVFHICCSLSSLNPDQPFKTHFGSPQVAIRPIGAQVSILCAKWDLTGPSQANYRLSVTDVCPCAPLRASGAGHARGCLGPDDNSLGSLQAPKRSCWFPSLKSSLGNLTLSQDKHNTGCY